METKLTAHLEIRMNEPDSGEWLKGYLLLEKRILQVMMNLEFMMLPEFDF